MLKKIKAIIKVEGMSWVASQLGYRSMNTIYNWMRNGEIPITAQKNVKQFIEEYNA